MARAEARLRSQLKLPASLIDRTHSSGEPTQAKPTERSVKAAKNHHNPPATKAAKTRRKSAAAKRSRRSKP
jgi:hypothetical protein